jgi:hypothetical protein
MKILNVVKVGWLVFLLAAGVEGAEQSRELINEQSIEPIARGILMEHGFLPPVVVETTNGVVFVSERVKGPGTLDRIVGRVDRDGVPGAWITRYQQGPSAWAIAGKLLYDAKPECEEIEREIGGKLRVNPATGMRELDSGPELRTRTYQIDPVSFAARYEKVGGEKKANPPTPVRPPGGGIRMGSESDKPAPVDTIVKMIRQEIGVNLKSPGRYLYYNDRLGVLLIRATKEELDKIEKVYPVANRDAATRTTK